jgi:hypothetical protein
MADHDEERDNGEVYKVETVPPPPGEDDAYSAPTRIGPMAEAAARELMRQSELASGLAPGTLTGGAAPTKPPPRPSKPPVPTRPPPSSAQARARMFASNEPVELAPDVLVEEAAPPQRIYTDEEEDAQPAFPPASVQPASSSSSGPASGRLGLPASSPAPSIVGGAPAQTAPIPWRLVLGVVAAVLVVGMLYALFR